MTDYVRGGLKECGQGEGGADQYYDEGECQCPVVLRGIEALGIEN